MKKEQNKSILICCFCGETRCIADCSLSLSPLIRCGTGLRRAANSGQFWPIIFQLTKHAGLCANIVFFYFFFRPFCTNIYIYKYYLSNSLSQSKQDFLKIRTKNGFFGKVGLFYSTATLCRHCSDNGGRH